MLATRRLLILIFAIETLVFVPISLLILWAFLHAAHGATGAAAPFPVDQKVIAGAILLLSFLLGPLYATAWWTTWRRKASGRKWALTASVANAIGGFAPFLMPRLAIYARLHEKIGQPIWAQTAVGLAGLAIFWDRETWAQEVAKAQGVPDTPPEIPPATG